MERFSTNIVFVRNYVLISTPIATRLVYSSIQSLYEDMQPAEPQPHDAHAALLRMLTHALRQRAERGLRTFPTAERAS